MGFKLRIRTTHGSGSQMDERVFNVRLSSSFVEVLACLRSQCPPELLESCFSVKDFGKESLMELEAFKKGLNALCNAISGADARLLKIYSLKEEPSDPCGGGASGIGAIVDGKILSFTGGLGECFTATGAHLDERGILVYENVVDIRDKDIIKTDNGHVRILKSKPNKLREAGELRAILKEIEGLQNDTKVHVVIG